MKAMTKAELERFICSIDRRIRSGNLSSRVKAEFDLEQVAKRLKKRH